MDSDDAITTTFTDSEIIITNNSPFSFVIDTFNGPRYLFFGVTVTNVAIDSASSPAFFGVPSFTADAIMVNFAGLAPPNGAQFILDVTTGSATTPAVPEPSTWAMVILGFAGIGFMGYRRNSKLALMLVDSGAPSGDSRHA